MGILSKWVKRFGLLVLVLATMAGVYYALNRDNIHSVISDQVYRSAQLTPSELSDVVKRYHIKSVVNLRGLGRGQAWYDEEVDVARALNVKHYDLHLMAHTKPSPPLLRQLARLLQTAPRPILLHCKGGADRTGLASAMILLLRDDSFNKADQQISWRYFAFSRTSVGRLVMPHYACFLEQRHLLSSKGNFLKWVNQPNPYRFTQC